MTLATRSTEAAVEALVDAVRTNPERRDELVALLREDAAIYRDRGSATVTRIRGWILASFAEIGLPEAAVPFALDDLQNDTDPYGVAAAARAMRGLKAPAPPWAAEALVDALIRMRARDDMVTFERLRPVWPASASTSALVEVLDTLRHLGDRAAGQRERLLEVRAAHAGTWSAAVRAALDAVIGDLPAQCCAEVKSNPSARERFTPASARSDIGDIVLEDQAGRRRSFDSWFADRPALVAFFYTRCPNPNKCSATIAKLSELQGRLAAAGLDGRLRLAAVTYDPGFDDAERMRRYGQSHGLQFNENVTMLRSLTGIEPLRRAFDLRVGYVGSIVNRHAIELFLTAPGGHPVQAWTREQWDVAEVLDAVLAETK